MPVRLILTTRIIPHDISCSNFYVAKLRDIAVAPTKDHVGWWWWLALLYLLVTRRVCRLVV